MTNMKHPSFNVFNLFFFSSLLVFLILSSLTEGKLSGLTLKLVHRDSLQTNSSDSDDTIEISTCQEKHNRDVEETRTRVKYYNSIRHGDNHTRNSFHPKNGTDNSTDNGKTILTIQPRIEGFGYFYSAYAAIGTGRGMQTYKLHLDTGSPLTWVQCAPCNPHFRTVEPLFQPELSDSYRLAAADDQLCDLPGYRRGQGKCEFLIDYYDGTYAAGDLGFETFGFMSTDTGIIIEQVRNVPFGCARAATAGYPLNGPDGILGLMIAPDSFLTHVLETAGRRFSYCFTRSGSHNNQGYLTFGDHVPEPVPIPGTRTQRTPFLMDSRGGPSHYYLNLIDMSVGSQRMNFDPQMFARRSTGSGGTIIDTGSTNGVITTEAFRPIVALIKTHFQRLGYAQVTCSIYSLKSELCIQVPWGQPISISAPSITWHFGDGSSLRVMPNAIYDWKCNSRIIFLRIDDGGDTTLLGAREQANYRMTFDLEPGSPSLSFTPENC